jgi:hypothetical protein
MPQNASPQVPHLTETDLHQIREAVRHWGKPAELVHEYSEALLSRHFGWWEEFVTTDWDEDSQSEYDHDIGCRTWIQVAIEHATPQTREQLEALVRPLDDAFRRRMRPTATQKSRSAPITEAAYFWETHTIMRQPGHE